MRLVWDCYDRMYVHRGTVIQLKQEVSEITDFVMAVEEEKTRYSLERG